MSVAITKKQELINWIKELEDDALIQDLRAIKDDRSVSIEWDHIKI